MNAERLLAHYKQIAEASDAITRLRQFILDLAVRGKLVPQVPMEEPEISLDRGLSSDLTPPFEIPKSWRWSRLGGLGKLKGGGTPSKTRDDFWNGDIPWVSPKDMKVDYLADAQMRITDTAITGSAVNLIEPKSVLFVVRGMILAHSFPVAISLVPLTINQDMKALVLKDPAFAEYLLRALKGLKSQMLMQVQRSSHGTCRIEGSDYSDFLVPIPPISEQHRIVTKVDEMMTLCDQLEAARAKREVARDRLAGASLARLNAPAPETFKDAASFALDVLPALTARTDQIKQLRQTILNLAVCGKLVEQDPSDEPASALLARIGPAASGRVSKNERDQPAALRDENRTYPLPSGWSWTFIEDCFNVAGGIQKTPARAPRANSFPYLGVGNVYRGRLALANISRFELADGELKRYRLEVGDILVVEGNGSASEIGRCAVWNGEIEDCVHQNHLIRCRPKILSLTPYAELYLNSPSGMAEMKRLAITSAGLFSLSVGKIRKIEFRLPPLAEQHRIVAKVDELMALCDELEASLTTADDTRRRLLDVLLADALEPAAVRCEAA